MIDRQHATSPRRDRKASRPEHRRRHRQTQHPLGSSTHRRKTHPDDRVPPALIFLRKIPTGTPFSITATPLIRARLSVATASDSGAPLPPSPPAPSSAPQIVATFASITARIRSLRRPRQSACQRRPQTHGECVARPFHAASTSVARRHRKEARRHQVLRRTSTEAGAPSDCPSHRLITRPMRSRIRPRHHRPPAFRPVRPPPDRKSAFPSLIPTWASSTVSSAVNGTTRRAYTQKPYVQRRSMSDMMSRTVGARGQTESPVVASIELRHFGLPYTDQVAAFFRYPRSALLWSSASTFRRFVRRFFSLFPLIFQPFSAGFSRLFGRLGWFFCGFQQVFPRCFSTGFSWPFQPSFSGAFSAGFPPAFQALRSVGFSNGFQALCPSFFHRFFRRFFYCWRSGAATVGGSDRWRRAMNRRRLRRNWRRHLPRGFRSRRSSRLCGGH